jgi:hypothetical protein
MADIVDLKGEPLLGFDALAMALNQQAQLVANIALSSYISDDSVRAEHFARTAIELYDCKLAPLIAQMRVRLAKSNPMSDAGEIA